MLNVPRPAKGLGFRETPAQVVQRMEQQLDAACVPCELSSSWLESTAMDAKWRKCGVNLEGTGAGVLQCSLHSRN